MEESLKNMDCREVMATPAGFEPATFSLEGTRSPRNFNARSDKRALIGVFEPKQQFGAVRMTVAHRVAYAGGRGLPQAISVAIPTLLKRTRAM